MRLASLSARLLRLRPPAPSSLSPSRPLRTTPPVLHTAVPSSSSVPGNTGVSITFVQRDGSETPLRAPEGANLLEVAHANNVDLEGACEGSLACSTCHVYLEPAVYEALDEPGDDENDMLDLAFGLTEL